jgi:hypothetical protein
MTSFKDDITKYTNKNKNILYIDNNVLKGLYGIK